MPIKVEAGGEGRRGGRGGGGDREPRSKGDGKRKELV